MRRGSDIFIPDLPFTYDELKEI